MFLTHVSFFGKMLSSNVDGFVRYEQQNVSKGLGLACDLRNPAYLKWPRICLMLLFLRLFLFLGH